MRIQVGEVYMDKLTNHKTLYPNKTRKYLLPCLKEYGKVFMTKFNNVFKVASGIGDIIISNHGINNLQYEKVLFVLLNSKEASKYFIDFLEWIKSQPMYVDDYVYDNIQKSTFHMVVLKVPEKYHKALHSFTEGKYSEMFSKETIDEFFVDYPDIQKVLIKDHSYRIVFTNKLKRVFNVDVLPADYDGELEFPPKDITEVFNHHLKQ